MVSSVPGMMPPCLCKELQGSRVPRTPKSLPGDPRQPRWTPEVLVPQILCGFKAQAHRMTLLSLGIQASGVDVNILSVTKIH